MSGQSRVNNLIILGIEAENNARTVALTSAFPKDLAVIISAYASHPTAILRAMFESVLRTSVIEMPHSISLCLHFHNQTEPGLHEWLQLDIEWGSASFYLHMNPIGLLDALLGEDDGLCARMLTRQLSAMLMHNSTITTMILDRLWDMLSKEGN
jgi:hypothetical protein